MNLQQEHRNKSNDHVNTFGFENNNSWNKIGQVRVIIDLPDLFLLFSWYIVLGHITVKFCLYLPPPKMVSTNTTWLLLPKDILWFEPMLLSCQHNTLPTYTSISLYDVPDPGPPIQALESHLYCFQARSQSCLYKIKTSEKRKLGKKYLFYYYHSRPGQSTGMMLTGVGLGVSIHPQKRRHLSAVGEFAHRWQWALGSFSTVVWEGRHSIRSIFTLLTIRWCEP